MAFNKDPVVEAEFRRLMQRYNIEEIVETGTYEGDSTVFFASFGKIVHTVEVVPSTYVKTQERLRNYANVQCYLGNSADVIRQLPLTGPTIFYLDAHWHDYWPLRDELKYITTLPFPVVIVIDDFQVPGTNYHFDRYKDQGCNYDYIKDCLPNSGTYYYLGRTERQSNGVGKFYWVPDSGEGLFNVASNGERYSNL